MTNRTKTSIVIAVLAQGCKAASSKPHEEVVDITFFVVVGIVVAVLVAGAVGGAFYETNVLPKDQSPRGLAAAVVLSAVLTPIIIPAVLLYGLWLGLSALGGGFAELWALRPRRVKVPKAVATNKTNT